MCIYSRHICGASKDFNYKKNQSNFQWNTKSLLVLSLLAFTMPPNFFSFTASQVPHNLLIKEIQISLSIPGRTLPLLNIVLGPFCIYKSNNNILSRLKEILMYLKPHTIKDDWVYKSNHFPL